MSEKHRSGYMPWDRSGNRLLVQSMLGKNKPSDYDLPNNNFIYGKITAEDPEHVNEVMYAWKYHENSLNPNINKEKDLIKTNKDCTKNLLHTATQFYKFREKATSYKEPKEGTRNMKIKLPEEGFTYGKPLE